MKYNKLLKTAKPLPYHRVKDEGDLSIGYPGYEQIRKETHYCGTRVAKVGDWDGTKHDSKNKEAVATLNLLVHSANVLPKALECLRYCLDKAERGRIQDFDEIRDVITLIENPKV